MKIKLIPERTLSELASSITKNLPLYRAGQPFMIEDAIVLEQEIELPELTENDRDNVLAIYAAMKDLPLSIIRDKRFWTHLTHVEYIGYASRRWPLDEADDKAARRVKSRYLADDDRSIESRSAISRLFWTGYACSRFPGDFGQAVEVITRTETIHNDMIERPTIIEVQTVFNAVTRRLIENPRLLNRNLFREVAKHVNLACGSVFIEALSEDQVQAMVDAIIERMSQPALQAAA